MFYFSKYVSPFYYPIWKNEQAVLNDSNTLYERLSTWKWHFSNNISNFIDAVKSYEIRRIYLHYKIFTETSHLGPGSADSNFSFLHWHSFNGIPSVNSDLDIQITDTIHQNDHTRIVTGVIFLGLRISLNELSHALCFSNNHCWLVVKQSIIS